MAADSGECNIKVVCRVRPQNESEERLGGLTLHVLANDSVSIGGKTFTFDRVVAPEIAQADVYNEIALPIVKEVLSGYNGTIFAYGQTGSGKTYTMEGVVGSREMEGIIPRIVRDIFDGIYAMDDDGLEFHIKVTYLEIYLDKIRDLLDPEKTNLSVHEDKARVPYVKGVSERFVSSPEEVLATIDEGRLNRHVAVTNMNEHSSRSHSVFLIQVRQQNEKRGTTLTGKLYLVDLAGSEKVSKTGAEGSTLDEAKNINKSLSALGNVINALVEGSAHVPYRDSKLTRILQESLGGNARTTIVICCSPALFNEAETRSTLLFGMRAKSIKNQVKVNEELTADEWRRRYEKERDKCSRLRSLYEGARSELLRWRAGERVAESEQLHEQLDGAPTSAAPTAAAGAMEAPQMTSSPSLGSLTTAAAAAASASASVSAASTLYRQLDDKDDEIAALSSALEKLRSQLLEADALSTGRRECEAHQQELARLQAENDSAKDEVKEVLSALEELALNYDQKLLELQNARVELDSSQAELSARIGRLRELERESAQLRDLIALERRRRSDLLSNLLHDLHELLVALSGESSEQSADFKSLMERLLAADAAGGGAGGEVSVEQAAESKLQAAGNVLELEENMALLRLQLNKAKSELRLVAARSLQLEDVQRDSAARVCDLSRALDAKRLGVEQLEARVASLIDSERVLETKKRSLEELLDVRNEELTRLHAEQEVLRAERSAHAEQQAQLAQTEQEANSVHKAQLERQLEQQREQHARQVAQLRDELSELNSSQASTRDELQRVRVAADRAAAELERVRLESAERAALLERQALLLEQHEAARRDLRGLEDTVARELHTLHQLRKIFMAELQTRIKRSAGSKLDGSGASDETPVTSCGGDSMSGGAAQQQKIQFLENNLEQLTKVHKQLVHDNADLRLEIPKLEKRLRATMERVKALEGALRDAKEGAMRDRRLYQQEVERIKDAVRSGSAGGRRAQIAKPIRPGQLPPNLTTGAQPVAPVARLEH